MANKIKVNLLMKGGLQDEWIRELELEIIETDQVIGTATLYILDADGADAAGESMHDMCDAFDSNTYNCGEAVYNMTGRRNEFRLVVQRIFDLGYWDSLNVLLLSQLKIEPPYRGRGIGLIVLSRMIKRWGKGCSLAVMKPYPLQYTGQEADNTQEFKNDYGKLVRYYHLLVSRRYHTGITNWNSGVAIAVYVCDRFS